MRRLKTGILAAAMAVFSTGTVLADDIKIGSLSAITGPIVSMVVEINGAERAAVAEVNAAGGVLGNKLVLVEADTNCNPQTSVDAANKLVNVEQVTAIVGALCSSASIAAMSNVAKDAGVVMVSPASTSPAITTLDDNGLMFRVVPSDAYQGYILAKLLLSKGVNKVALTFINNDYGNGFADSFRAAFTANGGTIAGDQVHEENKASYRSELATLSGGGADTLVILALGDGSGLTIMKQAMESGFFKNFVGGDGMRSDDLIKQIGKDNLEGRFTGTIPTSVPSDEAKKFEEMYGDGKAFKFGSAFTSASYDATMLLALAIEAAGSNDRSKIAEALVNVATAPGEKIGPGQFAKAKELLAAGKDIDYDGAAGPAEFDDKGEVDGVIAEYVVQAGKYVDSDPLNF